MRLAERFHLRPQDLDEAPTDTILKWLEYQGVEGEATQVHQMRQKWREMAR